MLKPGLVSVTFRKLSPEAIVALVSEARLHGIEWGGDVHVPHGDTARACEVRRLTAGAGLAVAAYGSYYRAGVEGGVSFPAVLDSALALGAPLIRIWAGDRGSESAEPAWRVRVAAAVREACDRAASHGVRVATEFHNHTLTDTTESALQLFGEVGHPNLFSYWQSPTGWPQAQLEESLGRILPRLANLHVYNWDDAGRRWPLRAGLSSWTPLVKKVRELRPDLEAYAMLEFVRDDAPDAFREDAAALRELLGMAG